MNQYANQQQSKVQQIFNYQLSNQQEKTFRQLYSQSLQDCSKQLTYFDNASQNCGLCMPYCKICGDSSSCLQCEQQSYYDRSINKCVKKCQNSQYQQDYFEVCISCQVENCDICKFEGQSCQQCKQGWQLSSDKKFCLKSECMAKSYSFYNPETDSCTTNCPESYDLKSRTCIKLKQFSKINTLASKNKIKSEGFIKYVFYFDQISIAVTLDSKYAVIYSYPQLIPINYITCLNTYQGAIKNNQNLFLISEDNVQKIDLLQQNIEIVYQFKSNQFSYSQTKLILYLNPQIVIYSFSTGQEKTYKIKNNFSVDFSPSNLNSFEANNNGDSPNIPDSPQQNEISRLTQIAYDDQGCEFIQKTDQYLITPSLQNLNLIEIDYLSESLVRQQNNIDLFQNANSPQFYESSDSTLLFYLDESNTTSIYYLDKNMLIETSTTADSNIQVLSVYQFDGKTRFIAIKPSIYNGTYQSAVVCANLTLDGTTNQYQFEYDMPHFAQLTSQIIEYIITEDKNYLIIANAQGYEIINISPQLSMEATNSSQNQIYLFPHINNDQFSHSKFLSSNQSLYYQISNNIIKIYQLNFEVKGFSLSSLKQINLNSLSYSDFSMNFNQVQKVDNKTLMVSYKNQLQLMYFAEQGSNQIISYSSFTDQDSSYQMNGIFRVFYSEDTNFMAIVYVSGFRIIKVSNQMVLYEKNLKTQIMQAEILFQQLVLVYQYNKNYNFVIVDLLKLKMYQYQIQSGNIYISLNKYENPLRIYLSIYYSNTITLFCISKQKTDIFLINSSPQMNQLNQDKIIQVYQDTLFVNTIEYYILVFSYDLVNSQLTQIDNVYSSDCFSLINSNNLVVTALCSKKPKSILFNRANKQNQQIGLSKKGSGNNIAIKTYFSLKYNKAVLEPPKNIRGQFKVRVLDLTSYSLQELNYLNLLSANQDNFLISYEYIQTFFSFSDISIIKLYFPQFSSLSSNTDIIPIQDQAYFLIQNITNLQLYLFNIQNQQATQVFLKSSSENQISIIQSSQAVLYFQNSLVSNYILGSNNFQILYSDNSEYPEAQSQYLQDLFLYGKNAQDQYEVVDFQFNQIYLFSDQSQINYIQELDAFISINQDNQAFVLVLYDSTILAITSNTELVVYDFIINQQIKYLSSSFKCNLYSNFSSDIYCLENNNILKKFDQQLLDFVKIANQPNIQIEVNEFYALSQQILAFISFQGKMVLMNPQTQQVSDVISSLQQIDKINQFTYSNVRDVQHLYSDLFAFTLYNDIVLVKLNSQSSRVVETFRCYDISLSDLAFDHFNEINILLSKHYAVSDQFQYYTSFYGQNIGSNPKYIGITNRPQLESLQIAQKYHIDNIASGNYLDQKLYLNFIDEEDNPFNFIGSDTYYDRSQFYFYLNFQNNSQIIIQEGITAILNQTIGMFELNFQSFYKESQNQTIYIISNQFQQGDYLQIPLNLSYRNCVVGEIIQQNNQFIQCDQCVQGRYSLKIPDMQKDVNQLQCISCPEQAYFCQGSEIKLKNGYWRENNQTDQIYTCILESCAFDNPDSKQGCITGYIGALCNSCDSKQRVWGEQYGFKNMKCYPCSEQLNQISYVCFFILFYVFYTTMSQQKIIASKIKSIKLNIFKQIGLLITSSLSSSGNEASLLYKIFINYIQILSCSSNFGVFNQHILTTPVNLFGDPINMTVSTFDCLFKMSDKYPIWLNRISKMLIQSLICIKIGSKYYLTSDYSQECYDYYHLLYSLTAIIPLIIIFCFLIPYFLFSKLKYLQKRDSQHRLIYSKVGSIMTYGFLYTGYKTMFGEINLQKDIQNKITNKIKTYILKAKKKFPNFLRLIRIRQTKFKTLKTEMLTTEKNIKNNNLEEKNLIQNFESQEIRSQIPSSSLLLNLKSLQKDGKAKNSSLFSQFSPQKQKLMNEDISKQNQIDFNNLKVESKENQQITCDLLSPLSNNKKSSATEAPNQLENSNESGFVIENEIYSVQIGQHFIFDNIIASNKFQQTKKDEKSMEAE
ncbi:hypothetical protein ABPG74_004883 [Tetrahymena malaccensis]